MPWLNPITDQFMTSGHSSTLKEGKQVLTLQSTAYSISSMFDATLQGKDNRVGSPKGLMLDHVTRTTAKPTAIAWWSFICDWKDICDYGSAKATGLNVEWMVYSYQDVKRIPGTLYYRHSLLHPFHSTWSCIILFCVSSVLEEVLYEVLHHKQTLPTLHYYTVASPSSLIPPITSSASIKRAIVIMTKTSRFICPWRAVMMYKKL